MTTRVPRARAVRRRSFERPAASIVRWLVAATAWVGCADGDGSRGGSGGGPARAGAPAQGAPTSGGMAATSAGAPGTGGMAATSAGAPAMNGGMAATSAGAPGTGGSTPLAGVGGAPASAAGGRVTAGGQGGETGGGSSDPGASGASGASGTGGTTHTGLFRILPLGDSITDTTCYPKLLSKRLKDGDKTNFEFVGTRTNNQSCNGAPNVKTEGHGGYLVTHLVDDSNAPGKGSLMELEQWVSMASPPPDVVLMHFGTNDVWNGVPPATITSAYTFVLGKFRAKNPNLVVFAAKILPMRPNGCADSTPSCENNRVKALNAVIPDWAAQASTATSPIHVVDIYASVDAAGFTPNSALTTDGVHPNVTASDQMAKAWYDALVAEGIP